MEFGGCSIPPPYLEKHGRGVNKMEKFVRLVNNLDYAVKFNSILVFYPGEPVTVATEELEHVPAIKILLERGSFSYVKESGEEAAKTADKTEKTENEGKDTEPKKKAKRGGRKGKESKAEQAEPAAPLGDVLNSPEILK